MIEVKNLSKRYGNHLAVDDLSFTILDGEIIGFLGPNGAGKTTTMNIMTGYLSPTDGSIIINGYDMLDEPAKAKASIGYLPDTPPLYNNMLVAEYLNFVADIKKVQKNRRKEHLAEIMDTVKITDIENRLIKNLSKGYRQRVGLAQAMIGTPDVIILDEPTVGLDPQQIIEMRSVIKNLGKKHTVILSSHILSEVSAVCDRVMIINKGRIVASDTPERLSENITGNNQIAIRIKGIEENIQSVLESSGAFQTVRAEGIKEGGTCDFVLEGPGERDIRETAFNILADHRMPILQMKNLNLSLEEIFLQVTTDNTIATDGITLEEPAGEELNSNSNEDDTQKLYSDISEQLPEPVDETTNHPTGEDRPSIHIPPENPGEGGEA